MGRSRDVAVYEGLYSIIRGERSEEGYRLCIYCGLPADTYDHVPPISRVEDYRAYYLEREEYLKICSCRQCNNYLGDTIQPSVLDRLDALKIILEKKLSKYLRMGDWTEEELSNLNGRLKQTVEDGIRLRDAAEYRLDYYKGQQIIMDWLEDKYMKDVY